jgi:hypothetical protein
MRALPGVLLLRAGARPLPGVVVESHSELLAVSP